MPPRDRWHGEHEQGGEGRPRPEARGPWADPRHRDPSERGDMRPRDPRDTPPPMEPRERGYFRKRPGERPFESRERPFGAPEPRREPTDRGADPREGRPMPPPPPPPRTEPPTPRDETPQPPPSGRPGDDSGVRRTLPERRGMRSRNRPPSDNRDDS
jgi:hypothetical protein